MRGRVRVRVRVRVRIRVRVRARVRVRNRVLEAAPRLAKEERVGASARRGGPESRRAPG